MTHHGSFELTRTDVQMINSRPRKRSDRISYGHLYHPGIRIEIIGNWFFRYTLDLGTVHTLNIKNRDEPIISHILSRLRTTSRGVEVNSDDNKMISNGSIQRTHNRRNGSLDLSSPLGSLLFGFQPRVYLALKRQK